MFGVGLHFSLKDLLSVRRIAIPGAVGQMAVATALGMGLAYALGWTPMAGLVFGLALSVASTVVLLRAAGTPHRPDRAQPHRRRLADRRGPGDGAGAGPDPGAGAQLASAVAGLAARGLLANLDAGRVALTPAGARQAAHAPVY